MIEETIDEEQETENKESDFAYNFLDDNQKIIEEERIQNELFKNNDLTSSKPDAIAEEEKVTQLFNNEEIITSSKTESIEEEIIEPLFSKSEDEPVKETDLFIESTEEIVEEEINPTIENSNDFFSNLENETDNDFILNSENKDDEPTLFEMAKEEKEISPVVKEESDEENKKMKRMNLRMIFLVE